MLLLIESVVDHLLVSPGEKNVPPSPPTTKPEYTHMAHKRSGALLLTELANHAKQSEEVRIVPSSPAATKDLSPATALRELVVPEFLRYQ
jgi:hypothetical protein